jgi:hypothetical protein
MLFVVADCPRKSELLQFLLDVAIGIVFDNFKSDQSMSVRYPHHDVAIIDVIVDRRGALDGMNLAR